MTVCVPIKRLKDPDNFLKLVDTEGEEIVTRDNVSAFRCTNDFDSTNRANYDHEKLATRMRLAKEELENGKYSPFEDVIRQLR